MALVGVKYIIKDMDIVVCPWVGSQPVFTTIHFHANQIRRRVVAHAGLCVPEVPVEAKYATSSKYAIKDPDDETGPDEDVPFAIDENLDVVVHRPERDYGQDDMGDEKNLVVCASNTI